MHHATKNWETETEPVVYYVSPESSVMQQVGLGSAGVFSVFLVCNGSGGEEKTRLLLTGNSLEVI